MLGELDVAILATTDTDLRPVLEAFHKLPSGQSATIEVAAWRSPTCSKQLQVSGLHVWSHFLDVETTEASMTVATTTRRKKPRQFPAVTGKGGEELRCSINEVVYLGSGLGSMFVYAAASGHAWNVVSVRIRSRQASSPRSMASRSIGLCVGEILFVRRAPALPSAFCESSAKTQGIEGYRRDRKCGAAAARIARQHSDSGL